MTDKKLFQQEPIDFVSIEDLSRYKQNQKVKFVCSKCGHTDIKYKVYIKEPLLCKKCSKVSSVKGKDWSERQKKSEATKLERYGDAHYTNPDKISETWNNKSNFEKKEIYDGVKSTNEKKYGCHPASRKEQIERTKQTCIEKYGYESPSMSSKIKAKIEQTNIERYGAKNVFASDVIKKKIEKTNLRKYGVKNPRQAKIVDDKIKDTCMERYGTEHPWSNHDVRVKCQQSYRYRNISFDSSWELAYYIYLTDNDIPFEYQPDVFFEYGDGKRYYPDFLVHGVYQEIKGEQFFDGDKMINPYDRTMDDEYEAKHQCMILNHVEIIRKDKIEPIIEWVERKYTKDFLGLFKTDIKFPFPPNRMDDYSKMVHFHKSIYYANRHGYKSPYEAFKDPVMIEKSARNRLKYVHSCKPSDIVTGFNVAKIAPKVSVFSPYIASELVQKYLSEYSTIRDPFSGFSGRMIGTCKNGKTYIGSDLNKTHIIESKEVIRNLNLQNAKVFVQDILAINNESQYECLFTCPPYADKEQWNGCNDTTKSCDEWIDICLEKFNCKAYLFVVDTTEKYKEYVVDTIENRSHFGVNVEKVILIKK